MTYDIKAIHKIPFSWTSLICVRVSMLLVLLFLTVLPSLPLQAASLTYDKATGKLVGFDVERNDTPDTVDSYNVSGEFWREPGYVGRLLYVGAPTTFTFSNIGPIVTPTPNPTRFYFTQMGDNGHSREFFLVLRAKGLLHEGIKQDDFSKKSAVIESNNGTFILTEGAGDEPAIRGQTGYDESGISGKYNGSNQFKYRYRYSHIWIDATIIHTSNKTWIDTDDSDDSDDTRYGHYISNLLVSTANGENLILNLHGSILASQGGQTTPFFYFLDIVKEQTSAIPFNQIKNLNNVSTALEIATLKYYSDNQKAKITFSSDAGGINTNFSFKNTTGQSFTHKLAFQPTLPAANVGEITPTNRSFVSYEQIKTSPIGDTSSTHLLEGKIKLFIPPGTTPPVGGTYKSTIYVLVEPTT